MLSVIRDYPFGSIMLAAIIAVVSLVMFRGGKSVYAFAHNRITAAQPAPTIGGISAVVIALMLTLYITPWLLNQVSKSVIFFESLVR